MSCYVCLSKMKPSAVFLSESLKFYMNSSEVSLVKALRNLEKVDGFGALNIISFDPGGDFIGIHIRAFYEERAESNLVKAISKRV